MINAAHVLQSLIDSLARHDLERFARLCQVNAAVILEHFSSWRTVPVSIRGHPEKLEMYANALIQTARLFEQSGYPQLLTLLMPPDSENPLARWQSLLREASQLANLGAHEQSLAKVEELLVDLVDSGTSGPGLLDVRARSNGLKGMNLFVLKRYAEARAALTAALADCERGEDEEGVRTYRSNLVLLETYSPVHPERLDTEIVVLEAFAKARRLADLHRFRASNDVLAGLLSATGDAADIVETIRPHILGRMGFNEFKLGSRDKARRLIASARDLSLERQDQDGAEIYAENLLVVERHAYPLYASIKWFWQRLRNWIGLR